MRRFLLILTPALLLGLAACGGTQGNTTPAASGSSEVRVLAEAAGAPAPVSTEVPPAPEVPANAVQSLSLEGAAQQPTANGGLTVSGTIVNNGPQAAKPTRVVVMLVDAVGQTVSRASFSDPRFTAIAPGAGLTWQGDTLFGVGANQRLVFIVEGVAEGGQ
jgi:hypothetical protein